MRTLGLVFLIICSYTDIKERSISRVLLAVFLTSAVMLMMSVHFLGRKFDMLDRCLIYNPDRLSIICALIPGFILLVISIVSKGAVGRGDVYVIAVLGLMMGFDRIFFLLFLSMFLTAVFGLACMVFKGMDKKTALPYVPFLLGSYVLYTVVYGFGS